MLFFYQLLDHRTISSYYLDKITVRMQMCYRKSVACDWALQNHSTAAVVNIYLLYFLVRQ